jgi:Xaa-Pro dipeptidase
MQGSPGSYEAHVEGLARLHDEALAHAGFDAAVVGSGILEYRFRDDQAHPYVANPDFLRWAPLTDHPGSCIVYRPGTRPVLLVHRPEDYWHQPPALPAAPVAEVFDVRVIGSPAETTAHLPASARRLALLGPPGQWAGIAPGAPRNPESLLDALHYDRACKSPWEVERIRRAAAMAARGHHAAEQVFRGAGSEYDILNAFLRGCGQLEPELPYPAIVALNEHGATLHYQHRDRRQPGAHTTYSLLIDAGCAVDGYACDITRTHAFRDEEFAAMISDLDRVQQALCAAAGPGTPFPDLHRRAHRAIAGLLRHWDLVRLAPEAMLDAGVTLAFFPHGLGHLLGLQVHDTGGHLASAAGGALPQPPDYPRLRLTRTLEAGQVVTIEPGVYFIESLLESLRAGPAARHVNWDRIAHLKRYGGIRIEDDVLVTASGHENLTRPRLAALA